MELSTAHQIERTKWRRFGQFLDPREGNIVVVFAVSVLTVVLVCGVFAPWVAPFDPLEQNLVSALESPALFSDADHPYLLGTDALGRDLLSRLIYGARISLLVGVLTVLVRGGLGVSLGLLAGFYKGPIDDIIMRIADIQLVLPFLVVAVAVLSVLDSGVVNVVIVLGLTGWVYFARVVRSEVVSLRERDFVLAARAIGATNWYIIFRHVWPNTVSSVLVIATLQVASVIIAEASLSFLGLGVGALTPSWGKAIAEGRDYVAVAWWMPVYPGIALFLMVLSINLLGDWLRDAFDPRLRRST